jgi:hypothetical protein
MQQTHEAVAQRDYRLALSRAVDANERALEAARQAADGKARAQTDAQAVLARALTAARLLSAQLKAAEAARVPAPDLEAARRVHTDAQRALQEARTAMAAGTYLVAIKQLQDVPDKIAAQTAELTQAIDARSGRSPRRRR